MTAELVHSKATGTDRIHIRNGLGSTVAICTPGEASRLVASLLTVLKGVERK